MVVNVGSQQHGGARRIHNAGDGKNAAVGLVLHADLKP